MIHEPTAEEETLAERLVEEVLDDYAQLLTASDLELMRAVLVSDLIATEEGQRTLRACLPDPVLDRSDDLRAPGVVPIAASMVSPKVLKRR